MFSLANILQIAQWRIQGRGQTGGGGGHLRVWTTESSLPEGLVDPSLQQLSHMSCLHFGYFFLAKCTKFSVILVSSTKKLS